MCHKGSFPYTTTSPVSAVVVVPASIHYMYILYMKPTQPMEDEIFWKGAYRDKLTK
jgi:hypothetical protein